MDTGAVVINTLIAVFVAFVIAGIGYQSGRGSILGDVQTFGMFKSGDVIYHCEVKK